MSSMRDFRDAVRREADRTPVPALSVIIEHGGERGRPTHRLTWAVAAGVALMLALGGIPLYDHVQQTRQREQDRADAMLMEKVNRALSRSVPQALEPLMGGRQCEPRSC